MMSCSALLSSMHCLHREEDVKLVMEMALKEANASDAGLTFEDVAKALEGSELRMEVEMPVDY